MKPESRVLGFDDAPFRWEDREVPVVGVVMRCASAYVDGVLTTRVAVDGADATDALVAAVNGSRFKPGLQAILVDGIALGGFNVVNLARLRELTGVPVVSVTRGKPDLNAMREALRKHFEDWEVRWALVQMQAPVEIRTETTPLYVRPEGMSLEEAVRLLALTTARGLIPEPLRLAHLIATAIARGESRGQ